MWALIDHDNRVYQTDRLPPAGRYCAPAAMTPPMQAWVEVPTGWEPYINHDFSWSADGGWTEPRPGYVLECAKAEALTQLNTTTEAAILGGFEHAVDGVAYQFSYDRDDQGNFSEANSAALLALTTQDAAWRMTWRGWVGDTPQVLSLDVAAYLALAQAAGNHKTATLAAGWSKQELIKAAATLEELAALNGEDSLDELVETLEEDNV